MTRSILFAVTIVLFLFPLASDAVEIGVHVSISYDPNIAMNLGRLSLPLSAGLSLYGEFQADRWTASVSTSVRLLRWPRDLTFAAAYSVTPRVTSEASLAIAWTQESFKVAVLGFGLATQVSEGALKVGIGSMPLVFSLMNLLDQWTPCLTVVPDLFVKADLETPGGMHIRERVDFMLVPVKNVILRDAVPPSQIWQHSGLALALGTSFGFRIR